MIFEIELYLLYETNTYDDKKYHDWRIIWKWLNVDIYLYSSKLSFLIMIQNNNHVHKFKRSCYNFLSHIVFFFILFTYQSAYNSKSNFLI